MSVELIRHDAQTSSESWFSAADVLVVLRSMDEYRERALRAEKRERELEEAQSLLLDGWAL